MEENAATPLLAIGLCCKYGSAQYLLIAVVFFWINNSVKAAVTVVLFCAAWVSLQRVTGWPELDELDELELEELELEELLEDDVELDELLELEEAILPELELLEELVPGPLQANNKLEQHTINNLRIIEFPLISGTSSTLINICVSIFTRFYRSFSSGLT